MPINFSNVNVSLSQFQAVSTGKYNAGEVKLTSETTIDKVNNRVHRTGANKTDISHDEVLAIKQAFVKALAQGGVGAEEIARIRRDLGLGTDKAVDTSLKDRSIRPLTRQQVREILDRNAAAINAHEGAGTIRTSAELQAGVSAAAKQSRAVAREAANAGLAATRTVAENHRIALFQALVAGDVDFQSNADRAELLKMANDALDIVVEQSGGRPREGVPARIAWGVGGEKRLSMDTGLDEAAWARKLEDAIVRLHHLAPGRAAQELREEFRAVPHEGRAAWLDAMPQDDDAPWKVRTLVVALLQDAGVSDHESLSLANRLPDVAARTLLRNLAALPEGATADDARGALAHLRDLAGAPAGSRAYVPATTVEDFNREVVTVFSSKNANLFGAFKTLAAGLLAEARAVFGAEVVPADAEIGSFVNVLDIEDAIRAAGEGVRAAPDALRAPLRRAVFEKAADRALRGHVAVRAAELREAVKNPSRVANAINAALPELKGRIAACADAAAIAAALAEIRPRVDAEIRRTAAIERGQSEFDAMVRDALSAKTGIPAAALVEPALSSARIVALASKVSHALLLRENDAGDEAGIREAYRAEAERFAAERAAILEKAEALPLSAPAKVELKEWLLAQDKVGYLDLDAILAEAAKCDLAPLAAALRSGAPKEQVYAAMRPFTAALKPTTFALLQGKGGEIGTPEMTNVQTIFILSALDRHPGIRQDLAAFFARPDVNLEEIDPFDDEDPARAAQPFASFGMPGAAEAKAALAEKIAAGEPSPIYAQALARAVRAEGLDLSPDEALAVFTKGTPLGGTFAQILGGFEGEVTPKTIETIARAAVRSHGSGYIQQMVETLRGDLLRNVETDHYYSLPEKYLDAGLDALRELRGKYGEENVAQNAQVTDLVNTSGIAARLRPVVAAARAAHHIVTPAEFRQAVLEAVEQELLEKLVRREADAIAAELGLAKAPGMIQRLFVRNNAALAAAIREARFPRDVAKAVQDARGALRDLIAMERELAGFVATANDIIVGRLASATGLTREEAAGLAYRTLFDNRLGDLKGAILDGTHPGSREEGFSSAMEFNRLIEDFVDIYSRRFAAIDALQGVSDETKADLREVLKNENRPDKPFIDPAPARRIAAKLDGAALLAALDAPDATDETRIAAVAAYADRLDEAIMEEYRELIAQRGEGLGTDDLIPIVANVRAFVMGATPGLKDALARLAGTPFGDTATIAFMQGEHQAHPLRATVANSLF